MRVYSPGVFSRRTGRSRAPNLVAEVVADARASGLRLYDLSSSNPTSVGIVYPDDLLRVLVRAQREALTYRPEPFGSARARQAVARYLSQSRAGSFEVDDIMLSASTSEAYSFLFKLLCDPGAAVLIPAPSYPLFEHLAELEGVRVVPYRLAYDGAWHVDLDSVRRAMTPDVRAVVVVSPNNPTGHYVEPRELEALAELGLPLICDEVFFEYPLERTEPVPSGQQQRGQALTFSLGGLSKLCGSPQLKLGWTSIGGPKALVREARERLELIADTFLSVGTGIQAALPTLLELAPRITAAIGARCRENLAALKQAAEATPVSVLRTEGGWSAVLRLPAVGGEEELVTSLLQKRQVLVQPGYFYDFETEPYAIVSLLGEPGVFAEGAARLVAHVSELAGAG